MDDADAGTSTDASDITTDATDVDAETDTDDDMVAAPSNSKQINTKNDHVAIAGKSNKRQKIETPDEPHEQWWCPELEKYIKACDELRVAGRTYKAGDIINIRVEDKGRRGQRSQNKLEPAKIVETHITVPLPGARGRGATRHPVILIQWIYHENGSYRLEPNHTQYLYAQCIQGMAHDAVVAAIKSAAD